MEPHWIPSTTPVWVVLAGAISAPCSIGTPSKPIWADEVELLEEPVDVEPEAVPELDDVLELDELLLPQPASSVAPNISTAPTKSARNRERADIGL